MKNNEFRIEQLNKALRVPRNCKYCGILFPSIFSVNGHQIRCVDNPNKLDTPKCFKKHSDESKAKISHARIKYLENNPDKVPYRLNHSSKRSYPERYFSKILNFYSIVFTSEYRIGLYSLDFAITDLKIDLEIDGDQHYLDDKIIKSDAKRTKYLENNGWTVLRIKWSDYKKKCLKDRQIYVTKLINNLTQKANDD